MPEDLKYVIMIFKVQGHSTWRMAVGKDEKSAMKTLGEGAKNIIAKKFIEVDRVSGKIEEY